MLSSEGGTSIEGEGWSVECGAVVGVGNDGFVNCIGDSVGRRRFCCWEDDDAAAAW